MPPSIRPAHPRQRSAPKDGVAPIDHEVLNRLLCEDQEAVGVVLRQFRSSCPGDASALGVALSRNDGKEALRWAHRLKGACQMVGAMPLAGACERVETAIRAGDAGLAAAAVADVEREADRISGYLGTWFSSHP